MSQFDEDELDDLGPVSGLFSLLGRLGWRRIEAHPFITLPLLVFNLVMLRIAGFFFNIGL
ncbi:MAG: hypothetical protein HYZ00_11660 [Candidatus Hydrogenedentes bacterium]|nr:hypothetical protein [Candidatus Hydrogenedentota bacterium]